MCVSSRRSVTFSRSVKRLSGQMPRREQRVDVRVERDLPLVEEPEKTAGEHGLADRAGEKERRRVHRLVPAELGDAVALGEDDAEVVDHRDAHRRHVIRAHAVEQFERDVRLLGDADAVAQVMLHRRRVLRAGGEGEGERGRAAAMGRLDRIGISTVGDFRTCHPRHEASTGVVRGGL